VLAQRNRGTANSRFPRRRTSRPRPRWFTEILIY
jgi:hypothetical protein